MPEGEALYKLAYRNWLSTMHLKADAHVEVLFGFGVCHLYHSHLFTLFFRKLFALDHCECNVQLDVFGLSSFVSISAVIYLVINSFWCIVKSISFPQKCIQFCNDKIPRKLYIYLALLFFFSFWCFTENYTNRRVCFLSQLESCCFFSRKK